MDTPFALGFFIATYSTLISLLIAHHFQGRTLTKVNRYTDELMMENERLSSELDDVKEELSEHLPRKEDLVIGMDGIALYFNMPLMAVSKLLKEPTFPAALLVVNDVAIYASNDLYEWKANEWKGGFRE